MKRFDLTINFKLHANVLSAAADVPFLCLGYRFKSFDFAQSIGLPQFAIYTDAAQLAERIRDTAAHALANRMSIVSRIGNPSQQAWKSLSWSNYFSGEKSLDNGVRARPSEQGWPLPIAYIISSQVRS